MIIPLEFIFGGGEAAVGDGENDDHENRNLTLQTGGAVDEIFSKRCGEIKNKYGVPIGYSCITTQLSMPSAPQNFENYNSNTNNIEEDEEKQEIDDDMFNTLFTLASTDGEIESHKKVSTIRKTKRVIEKPKKRRSIKKKV